MGEYKPHKIYIVPNKTLHITPTPDNIINHYGRIHVTEILPYEDVISNEDVAYIVFMYPESTKEDWVEFVYEASPTMKYSNDFDRLHKVPMSILQAHVTNIG